MGRPGARGLFVVGAAWLAACTPTTNVVLLPEPDGRKTAVTVTDSRGAVVLDHPYAEDIPEATWGRLPRGGRALGARGARPRARSPPPGARAWGARARGHPPKRPPVASPGGPRVGAARARGLFVAWGWLAACTPTTNVVLLPEPDGRKTAVTVTDSRGEVVLDHPYAAVSRTSAGTQAYDATPAQVQRDFGAALAAQPRREMSFTLHFAEGKDELTADSQATIESVLAEVAKRPVADVLVVGHTDRVGTDPVNDALAKQRAETVRSELIRRGLAPASVQASGRGSRDPIVPTPQGVAEPRNRRVDIIVR